jgi:hypothetical protein
MAKEAELVGPGRGASLRERDRYSPTSGTQRRGLHHGPVASQGNAADSEQLVPMVDEVIRRTTVIPGVLSVDDGYASAAEREHDEGPQR